MDSTSFGQLATRLMEDMEKEYGDDAEVTAMLAVAAVKDHAGHVYIQYRAADGAGGGLAPWHVEGILDYISRYSKAR